MEKDETDLFFSCLMGLVVFFFVAMAIIIATTPAPPPPPTQSIGAVELYTRLVRVCKAIDITNSNNCHSIVYLMLQNVEIMP